MITQWRRRILAREQARVAEHQWRSGRACVTAGTAELAVRQLRAQLGV